MEHLEGLNPKQREAAMHTDGPLLIVAGAGAGKTKTITHRIMHLVHQGVAPSQILAVTFTNKAAKEMRERITTELSKTVFDMEGGVPFVSTFHSLGVHIIKENASALGLNRHFTILDEGDANSMVKESLKELGYDPKEHDPRKIKNIISREKGKFTDLADYKEFADGYTAGVVKEVWGIYESKKAKEGALDFDDLLLKAVKLLKEKESIRKNYQEHWQYIHIDEYQDTNEVQYLMCKLLADSHKNICVVGDADQNIYSWRGANLKNLLSFEKDYQGAKVVFLEQNYRSTQNILEAANEVIKKNKWRPEKNLFTKNKTGEKISLYEALDEGDEAEFVATKVLEILDGAGNAFSNGLAEPAFGARKTEDLRKSIASEVAILYRANFQSRILEEAMLRYNIPYQVLGIKFFERREIKDTLAYIRGALNPDSLSDIKRIINFPARGIGKTTLAKLFAGDKASLPVKMQIKINNFYALLEQIKEKIGESTTSEVVKFVVKKSGIEEELFNGGEEERERLENIKELATLALKYDALPGTLGIEKLLEDASLASDQDSLIERGKEKKEVNAVKLMTVHASKGLEFGYVFIVGLEDGLFPHERQGEKPEDSEEERRLFYVALTRAKEKAYLSFANFRTIFGSRQMNAPSEFIYDIPADLIEREGQGNIKTIYI